jgi:hypothetical protein
VVDDDAEPDPELEPEPGPAEVEPPLSDVDPPLSDVDPPLSDVDPPLSDVAPPSLDPSPLEPPDEPAPAPVFAARRSFLAQPEPLKWTAGAAMALRTGPFPHNGQLPGGSSWSPWITSKRRPQAAQT